MRDAANVVVVVTAAIVAAAAGELSKNYASLLPMETHFLMPHF